MTSDHHAQLLHSTVATMEKQAQLLEQFQKSKQLSEIKLEGVKFPTYGGRLNELFQLYKEQMEQYFFARGMAKNTLRLRWNTEARSRLVLCDAKTLCHKCGRLFQQSRA